MLTSSVSPSETASRLAMSRRNVLSGMTIAPAALITSSFTRHASSAMADASSSIADGLDTGTPAALGMDATRLNDIVDTVRNGTANIHSLLIMRHGKLVTELYRAGSDRSLYSLWSSRRLFTADDRHDMRSVSKSVVGLLYGILIARGKVADIETPVASLYPEYQELNDTSRRAIRIHHLLTMTAGLEWNEPSPVHRTASTDETGLALQPCAYGYVFRRAVIAPPGTLFTYSGGLTAVLAEIMARSVNGSLREIANEHLFAPLGITNWEWVGDVYGKPIAAAGLRLRPRDFMKIGTMMLAGGQWQGRRIVPSEWIMASTKARVVTPPVGSYGFQWWSMTVRWKDRHLPVSTAIGNGGQRLFLVPALDLAIVTTAGDYGDPAIAGPLNDIFQAVVDTVTT